MSKRIKNKNKRRVKRETTEVNCVSKAINQLEKLDGVDSSEVKVDDRIPNVQLRVRLESNEWILQEKYNG